MFWTTHFFTAGALIFSMGLASVTLAQESGGTSVAPAGSKLSDSSLSDEELAQYVLMAQKQLIGLTQSALDDVKAKLEKNGLVSPSASMILDDGTIKPLRLGEEASQAPYSMQLVMYRTALKSMARHGKISAAAITYSGGNAQDQDAQAVIIEYEHRLGVSGVKLVPIALQGGEVSYGEVMDQKKPFQMFYDPREGQLAGKGGES